MFFYFSGGEKVKEKKTQKKKHRKKENRVVRYNQEIAGILILSLGTLILFSFYLENSVGLFGVFMRQMLTGLFGVMAFIIPPMIVIYGLFVIFRKDTRLFRMRMLFSSILVVLISSIIQTGFYDENDFTNLGVLSCIRKFFEDGKVLKGGGVIGGLISTPFLMTFQVLGTIIILTTLSVIVIILLTNFSIAGILQGIREFFAGLARRKALKKKQHKNDVELGINEIEYDRTYEPASEAGVIDFMEVKSAKEAASGRGASRKGRGLKDLAEDILEDGKEPAGVLKDSEQDDDKVRFIMKDIKKSAKDAVNSKDEVDSMEKKSKQKEQNAENAVEEEISIDNRKTGIYRFPDTSLLSMGNGSNLDIKRIKNAALEDAKKLEETLLSFGVEAKVINISRGPTITRYELQPSPGVKVSKIVNLTDDISLNLASAGVRIEAPIPGKAAVGIEVPNKEITPVMLREVIESPEFIQSTSKLAFALGKDITGETVVADIAKMPHLLVAGATGSGKSVCINNLILSLLYKATPDEVKLLLIDPKVVEMGIYNGIPHLLIPVVTDPKKAAGALNWAVQEMVNRYKLFAEKGVRDIKGYNLLMEESGEQDKMPQVVIIIDELADLMMVAPNEVEDAICRLAQMARAAGMHLVVATQRPSVDVITGVIKANIPSRIAFKVTSQVDSRTILDMAGAEKLLGKGDMLFYPVGKPKPIRVQGAYHTDKDIENVVEFIKNQGNAEYDDSIIEKINSEGEIPQESSDECDELLPQAIELVVDAGQASVSFIQRKFKVGYARAARIVDQMEERGIVGRAEGSKPRQVLITKQQLQEMQLSQNN